MNGPRTDLIPEAPPTAARPADGAVVLWALAVGVTVDLAARAGVASLATALAVGVAAIALIASGRVGRPQSLTCVVLAPAFAAWLAARSSPWLVVPDLVVAAGLLALGASLESGGDLFDLRPPAAIRRAIAAIGHGFGGAAFVVAGARPTMAPLGTKPGARAAMSPLVRGLAVAVPVLLVLGGLLRSADPVFASFVTPHVDGADLLAHPVLVALGAWLAGGAFRMASARPAPAAPAPRFRLGTAEALVVLVAIDALFTLFALSQLIALTGGAGHVLRTSGLTYADYARSGYFQLLWVAGLTLALLVTLDTIVDRNDGPGRRLFGAAGAAAAIMTVGIALVAFHRLRLYEHAFGLTMLRLSSELFAVWVGIVFALLALSLLGIRSDRGWFSGAALAAGMVILIGFNAMNPEAVVARSDLRRGAAVDLGYLLTLTDDAVPAVVQAAPRRSDAGLQTSVTIMCNQPHRHHGWASFNLSHRRSLRACGR